MRPAGLQASSLGRYLAWIAAPPALCVSGLLVAAVMVACHAGSEPAFRLTGLWLQLMGLLMTAIGFYRTRLFFKRRSVVVGGANITLSSVLSSGRVTTSPPREMTTDERLALLEESVARLLQEEHRRTREMKDIIEQGIAAERRAREEGYQRTDERLKEVQTGGLEEAIAGLIWVAFGTVMGGASDELSVKLECLLRLLG